MQAPETFGFGFLSELANIATATAAGTVGSAVGQRVDIGIPCVFSKPEMAEVFSGLSPDSSSFWHITWMTGTQGAAIVALADSSQLVFNQLFELGSSLFDSQQQVIGDFTDEALRREGDEAGSGRLSELWQRLEAVMGISEEPCGAARSSLTWDGGTMRIAVFLKPSSALEGLAETALARAARKGE